MDKKRLVVVLCLVISLGLFVNVILNKPELTGNVVHGDIEDPLSTLREIYEGQIVLNFDPLTIYTSSPQGEIHYISEEGNYICDSKGSKQWKIASFFDGKSGKLPMNFKPLVGYYHPFDRALSFFSFSEGEIDLLGENGEYWVFRSGRWQQAPYLDRLGLPQRFKPLLGYYNEFGNKINLFLEINGITGFYIYDSEKKYWLDRTSNIFIGDVFENGLWRDESTRKEGVLPEFFKPRVGYYFLLESNGGIHLFGELGEEPRLLIFDSDQNKWFDRTDKLAEMGLPEDKIPLEGYYDSFLEHIVLVYDDMVYAADPDEGYFFNVASRGLRS